jgi:pimeloyl-ACP methyl ester carboxylesterase
VRGYPRNRLVERSTGQARVVSRTTRSRGYEISFEDAGSGPALLLVPGWTMSAADWWDAGYIDHFAARHRVLAVDPLGNGLSEKPHEPDAYRFPDVGIDLVAAMDAAGVDRAAVWGYSRGASVAVAMAASRPDRVSGLILVGGGDLSVDMEPGTELDPVYEAMCRGDFSPLWTEYQFSDADRRYDAEFNDPIALGAMELANSRFGVELHLDKVSAPALVYVGERDAPDGDRKTADVLGVTCHVMAGLDHLQEFSRTDLVFPLVEEFLAANAPR